MNKRVTEAHADISGADRCRFGIGFGSYKHILLAVGSTTAVSGATAIA